jgi:hypothetical protein
MCNLLGRLGSANDFKKRGLKLSITTIFNEPACMAVIDSLITERVQQPYDRFGEGLLLEPFVDKWSIWTWAGQVRIDHERPRRSFQDGHRVRLIEYLKKRLMPSEFADTTDLKQRMESYLGDGRRLPLPQAIRRSDRIGHESQKTSGENGGDDD